MNQKLVILCVEDEPEVREAMIRDLKPFQSVFRIEAAEDVADARHVLEECTAAGHPVALALCDHVLPGENGVAFLVQLNRNEATRHIRKVLITGQAGQEDTIRAVNEAGLDYYITKPWAPEALQGVVRRQLTEYVIARVDPLLPFVPVLDTQRILEAISERRSHHH